MAATGVRVLIDDKFFAEVGFRSNEYFFDQTSKRNGLGRQDIQRRSGRTWIGLGISVELSKKNVPCYISMREFKFNFVNDLDRSYHPHARMTLNDSGQRIQLNSMPPECLSRRLVRKLLPQLSRCWTDSISCIVAGIRDKRGETRRFGYTNQAKPNMNCLL